MREFSESALQLNQHHSPLIARLHFKEGQPLPERNHFDDAPPPHTRKSSPVFFFQCSIPQEVICHLSETLEVSTSSLDDPLMHISNQPFESHLFSLHSICPKSIYFVHHYCYPSDSARTIVHLDHGSSLLTGLSCSLSSLPTTHDSTQRGNVNAQVCIGVSRIPPTLHPCPVTQNLEDRRVRNRLGRRLCRNAIIS